VAALELRADDLVDVEEAVLLQTDLDERRLHSGKDVVDRAEIDVPRDRAALRPLEIDLGDAVVLEDCDALFADVDGDDQLALRGRQRCAARSLAPSAAFLAAALLALRHLLLRLLALRLLPLGATRLVFGLCFGRLLAGGGRLLAPAPAPAAATALGLGGIGCTGRRLGGRFDYVRLAWSLGCGRLSGRCVGFVLPSSEPGQEETPSLKRATATPTGLGRRARCRSGMKTMCSQGSSDVVRPRTYDRAITTLEVRP